MLSVLIKPASGSCNMRCKYCFYADEMKNRQVPFRGVMTDATVENVVRKALAYGAGRCDFGFQGGEPTVAGLGFFKRFAETCDRLNTSGVRVSYSIQTNGLLIDREWAKFFKERGFLVGLSLDGPERITDFNRMDEAGNSVYKRVMNSAKILGETGVDFNVLTVVTRQAARSIREIYSFMSRNGFAYQQYIPCLDPMGERRGLRPYSLRPDEYGRFLKTLFDLWRRDRVEGRFVYIRYFENLMRILEGGRPESCELNGYCVPQFVVEADGSVYPCDFYMLDEYFLGNLNDGGFDDFKANAHWREFIERSAAIPPQCGECRYYALCRGGCRRYRLEDAGISYYCESYKYFLEYLTRG